MKRGKCGKNLRWELDGDTLTISGTGDMEDYSYERKTPWHGKRESIKRVVIADGVTSIGEYVFDNCTSLTSVTIGNSVTSIGEDAFSWCTSLTSVTIPDSVTSIGEDAFSWCTSLTSVTIPDSVTTIGGFAFEDCKRLTNVTIGNSVTTIDSHAFFDCENLTSVTIGNSVTSIGVGAFIDCKRLTNVTIGNSVTMIDSHAFGSCSSLTSITIPDSVTSIGNGAFSFCGLTSVTIPGSVTTIDDYVFSDCTSLKEIHYPAGRGFEKNLSQGNNAKLIPYTVTKPTVQPKFHPVQSTKPQAKFYPVQTTAQPIAEKLTWHFDRITLTVGGVREIKFFPYAKLPWLKHLHDIQRIVVGDGVEKIAAHAFEECTRLEMVTLPASVKTIGDMFASVAFCGNRFVNGGRNVFWCLEDGVLVLKKNPDAQGDDFSTGDISWIFAEKNIRGIKLEDGVKPTEKFYSWLTQRFNGKEISFR